MALTALISVARPSFACTVVDPLLITGSNFRVKVDDRGHPVKGLRIGLFSDTAGKYRAATDKNGAALFRNVPPGSYELRPDHNAGVGGNLGIEVKPTEPSDITVALHWPSAGPVSAASLRGVLHLPDQIPGKPQATFSLQLLEGISGQKLGNTNTDENGAFEFPGIGSGLYFLRLTGLTGLDGVIPISIEPSASAASLDLDVGWTSCGLFYSDRRQCPQPDLYVKRLAGRVVDASGAGVPDAEILLSDTSGNLVQRTQSDNAGEFGSPRPADGRYWLAVQARGFTTLRRTLIVEPNGAGSLEVQLGLFGCSQAKAP